MSFSKEHYILFVIDQYHATTVIKSLTRYTMVSCKQFLSREIKKGQCHRLFSPYFCSFIYSYRGRTFLRQFYTFSINSVNQKLLKFSHNAAFSQSRPTDLSENLCIEICRLFLLSSTIFNSYHTFAIFLHALPEHFQFYDRVVLYQMR